MISNSVEIGNICDLQEGYVNPSQKVPGYFGGGIRWLRAVDLNDAEVFETSRTLSQAGYESAGKSALMFPANSIGISKSGTIGRLGILRKPMCGNRAVINIAPKQSNDLRYIFYSLRMARQSIIAMAVGSVQKNLYVPVLESLTIPWPEQHVRDTIVDIAGSIDDKIAVNTRVNDYLTAMADARFAELVANAEDEIQLPQAINILSGGTPKTKEPSYWEDGTIPFFGPGDVKGAVYTLETEKHITELGLDNCNSSLYPVNTVFLTARGTVGKVAIAGRPMAMNQSCFAFSGIDWFPQTYVYQVIKRAVRSLKAKSNGATFAAINTRDLKDEMIPMPHRNAVEEYDKWATPLYALMLTNEEESIRLASLRDALLPKLMSGEVDVSRIELPTQPNNHLSAG